MSYKWYNAVKVHEILSCVGKQKFCISRSLHDKTNSLQNSFQPVKMAYNSFESVNLLDLSSNVPIIIMHGLLGSKNNWKTLSKIIHTQTKRKVITVDARNHGDSPHTSDMSYHHMVEDVRLLTADLNIPKATLIGHSMGGRTMMLFALKYPEVVENLIVVDIAPVTDNPIMSNIPSYLHALKEVDLDHNQPLAAARQQADRQLAQSVKNNMLRQFFLSNLVETEEGTFQWKMNLEALIRNFHAISTFPSVNARYAGRTCFIGGSDSDFIRLEDHDTITKFFPNADIEYIEGAGHWLHAEKPTEFIEVVCRFLNCK